LGLCSGAGFRIGFAIPVDSSEGFAVTLAFTFSGLGLGVVLGTGLAIVSQIAFFPLRWLVTGYVEFWRNTPLLVQLFWIQCTLPLLTGINTTMNRSGLIGVSLNTAAYYTEIVRSGIGAIGRGQWDAARALGLSRGVIWWKVVLPQAIRAIIPPTASICVSVFKATAILSILNVAELMGEVTRVSNYTYKPVELYTAAAFIYAVTVF
jgi:His/Glu/Gln/Arg/opine family amino acid ABC transporter permease subunit